MRSVLLGRNLAFLPRRIGARKNLRKATPSYTYTSLFRVKRLVLLWVYFVPTYHASAPADKQRQKVIRVWKDQIENVEVQCIKIQKECDDLEMQVLQLKDEIKITEKEIEWAQQDKEQLGRRQVFLPIR